MHSTTLFLALGFTLAMTSSAAPLSEIVGTATGVANVTTGEFAKHKHAHCAEHNITTHHTHNFTGEGDATEVKDRVAKGTGNPSPYPAFNASAYAHPHYVPSHNHTGDYCIHPSHHNMTATGATYDKIIHPKMASESGLSSHKHTGYQCTHPSHHNGTQPAGHSGDKKSMIPREDVTVCLGHGCEASTIATATVNSAGKLTGVDARDSKRMIKRQDTEISYQDVAYQMSGAGIAGGV